MVGDLAGSVVLVTGATSGIGRAAAMQFAARGAKLSIVGRNKVKTEFTAQSLRQATGNPAVSPIIGDLSLLSGMTAVAAEFMAGAERLDVLVNNAGAMHRRCLPTTDGLEATFALNHLAYFVLTRELFGLLTQAPGARVVNTASSAHALGRLDPELAATRTGPGGFQAYCDSKLANVLFTRELAARLAPFGVTANCLHPGFTRSRLFTGNSALARLAGSPLAIPFARSPEQASATLVWLATSQEAARYNGCYFTNRTVTAVSRQAKDAQAAARLWAVSEGLARRQPIGPGSGSRRGSVA